MATTNAKVGDLVTIEDEQVKHAWETKIYQIVEIHGASYAVVSPAGSFLYLLECSSLGKTVRGWIAYEHDVIRGHIPLV